MLLSPRFLEDLKGDITQVEKRVWEKYVDEYAKKASDPKK